MLLRKIKALAEHGTDGEQQNAQELLARLMSEHNISESEIEDEIRKTEWFAYHDELERRLLNQIIYMVTGTNSFGCVGKYSHRKRKQLGSDCTSAERFEIEANYEFFKIVMKKELEIFQMAFANKNKLFPKNENLKEDDEMTPDEKAKAVKASIMMLSMDKHTLQKALPLGET